jgi:hypothetical protein
MSDGTTSDPATVLVRAADARRMGFPPQTVRLLADSPSTGGKRSARRVTLQSGADGANPHHHPSSADRSTYSAAELSSWPVSVPFWPRWGPRRRTARTDSGAAAEVYDADPPIMINRGTERFERLRHVATIATGRIP